MRVSLGQQTSPLAQQAGCPTITGLCPAGQVNATDPMSGCPTQQCVGEAGNVPYTFAPATAAVTTDYTPYILAAIAIAIFVYFEKRNR